MSGAIYPLLSDEMGTFMPIEELVGEPQSEAYRVLGGYIMDTVQAGSFKEVPFRLKVATVYGTCVARVSAICSNPAEAA